VTTPVIESVIGSKLDGALVKGIAWTGGMKWVAQSLTWASSLIVARLLTPEDFGLVAMGSVYMGVVSLVSEFGVGASVINLRDLTHAQIAQLNGFALLMGLGGFVLSCMAAVPLGLFFSAPELPLAIVVMSIAFVVTGFRIVPAALLSRDMQFRTLAVMDGTRAAVMAVAMVVFAVFGFRYWTLVLGGLLSSTLYTAMTVSRRPHAIAWPRRTAIGRAMSFSTDILASRLAWYLYSTSDFLVAGRVLGKAPLGAYSMAWTLGSVPVEKVTTMVMRVTPSFFSAAQKDLAAMRRYLLVLTEGISLIALPAAIGLALVADDFVPTVLGERWLPAVLPLRLLAVYSAVRSVTPLFAPILIALGRTRAVLWNNVLALLLLPPAFYVGSHWGTAGIAAAWMVVHPVPMAVIARRTFKAIDLAPRRYFASIWPAASAALTMAGVVLVLRATIAGDLAVPVRFGVLVAAGASTYVAALLLMHGDRIRAIRTVFAQLRRPARESQTDRPL
jgi:PST family polysaccharide transporter